MLCMMDNRSPVLFGCFCHSPGIYIAADVRKKKYYFFSNDTKVADSCVMISACTLNPFTEKNAEILYRECPSMYVA